MLTSSLSVLSADFLESPIKFSRFLSIPALPSQCMYLVLTFDMHLEDKSLMQCICSRSWLSHIASADTHHLECHLMLRKARAMRLVWPVCQLYIDLPESEHLVYGIWNFQAAIMLQDHLCTNFMISAVKEQYRGCHCACGAMGASGVATWPAHGQHVSCCVAVQAMHQMTMMRAPDSLFGKGSAPPGHWAECAAQMQLAPEQVQHLFSIREAFCKRAAALRDQRRALVRQSTQVLPNLIGHELEGTCPSGLSDHNGISAEHICPHANMLLYLTTDSTWKQQNDHSGHGMLSCCTICGYLSHSGTLCIASAVREESCLLSAFRALLRVC